MARREQTALFLDHRSQNVIQGQCGRIAHEGANLADGFQVPVPRTVFGDGLQTEFFATPDLTGAPVATKTEPAIQYDWHNVLPTPELRTHDYSVRWTGTFHVPGPGKYTLIVSSESAFPYSPRETYRLMLDGKVLPECLERLVPVHG